MKELIILTMCVGFLALSTTSLMEGALDRVVVGVFDSVNSTGDFSAKFVKVGNH